MTASPPPLRLPPRAADAHKGNFGRVLLVGGSRGMAGSIALAAQAALRAGSGLVSAAVPDRCLETVASFHPCVMTIPLTDDIWGRFAGIAAAELSSRLDDSYVVGCGPGMTTGPGSVQIVQRLLEQEQIPRLFDADAINVLSELGWPDRHRDPRVPHSGQGAEPRRLVLTPHPGELARLVGVGPGDRGQQIDAAEALAQQTGVVVVIKGGPTVVVSPAGRWTNTTGNPGMATAGTGDVLTGVITSLLGQKFSAWDAARLGVWLHGRAGDLAAAHVGAPGMLASELLEEVGAAVREAAR